MLTLINLKYPIINIIETLNVKNLNYLYILILLLISFKQIFITGQ